MDPQSNNTETVQSERNCHIFVAVACKSIFLFDKIYQQIKSKTGFPSGAVLLFYIIGKTPLLNGFTIDVHKLRLMRCSELLQQFEYAEDVGVEASRKDIAAMEASLRKLEE
nr:hypothetical protein [uncultured Agathobaculum sp.]